MSDDEPLLRAQLQVNERGAWKSVTRFFWREAELHYVRTGVERIALASGDPAHWRIITDSVHQKVLQRFTTASGWQEPTL